jgi:hypothetical protein
MLIAEMFHVADNLKNRPLIYPILFKSAVFASILLCFYLLEENLVGSWHEANFQPFKAMKTSDSHYAPMAKGDDNSAFGHR